MGRQFVSMVIVLVASAAIGLPARAQEIPDRPTLDSLLSSSTTEDFEKFSIANGDAQSTTVNDLNSTTVTNGQGPGLVIPGINLSANGSVMQWDGQGYFGSPSKEVLSHIQMLTIDFAKPTDAFGLDLRAFARFTNDAEITIFAANDTTVISDSFVILSSSGIPIFYGYRADGNIGKVTFTSTMQTWSAAVDNLTFGSINGPEPASLSLVAMIGLFLAGLVRWRK